MRALGQRLGVFGMDIAAIVAIVTVQLEHFGGELIVAVVVGGTRHLCGAGNGHGDRDTSCVFDSNTAARASSFFEKTSQYVGNILLSGRRVEWCSCEITYST